MRSGVAQWNWSLVSFQNACEAAMSAVRPLIDQDKVKLIHDVRPCDLTMRGDKDAIRRLVLNLLNNACKNTSEGSVCVTAAALEKDGRSFVEIEVHDTGTGMTADVARRLGQAFGLSHVDVTREALARLETSDMVIQAAALHELETPQIERASRKSQDAMIVALANRLAHAALLGDSGNRRLLALHEHAGFLSLDGAALHEVANSAVEKSTETSMFYASQSNDTLSPPLAAEMAALVDQPVKVTVFAQDAPGDPLSLFFEQMGWLDLAEPEVGVLYVSRDVKPTKAWRDLLALEKEIGRPLGVLTVSPGGLVAPPAEEIAERPNTTAKVPGPYEHLIRSVSRLQSQVAAPASA